MPVLDESSHLPVLYSFRRCPYAIRARMTLRYAGIDVALREVFLRNKPADMLQRSPKGTVPVLVLSGQSDEQVLEESLDIMHWALATSDPDGWLDDLVADNQALISRNDDEFKHWLDRYKYPEHFDDIGAEDPHQHCLDFLDQLEQQLASQPYLFGAKMTLTDIAIFPFVRQYASVDMDGFNAGPNQALQKWLHAFLELDLFVSVMSKYPAWKPGDALTIF